jgi:sialate O-acetylesterase
MKRHLFYFGFILLMPITGFTQIQWSLQRVLFKTGDDTSFIETNLDDSNWKSIKIGSSWEDEGYWDYDGYAWYRVHFTVIGIDAHSWYWLDLGRLDDADITFLNGEEIGRTGVFPPNYETAYHAHRSYLIKGEQLLENEHVLAIRIYDERLMGGWLENNFRIRPFSDESTYKIPLHKEWRFVTGDDVRYLLPNYDDSDWKSIQIAQKWELQGYDGYNGFAWYRLKTELPIDAPSGKIRLNLGKIDDADQVYVNGVLVGSMGNFSKSNVEYEYNTYQKERIYELDFGLIKPGSDVVIAIRVYDGLEGGGMYEGIPFLEIISSDGNTTTNIWIQIWQQIMVIISMLWRAIFG